MERLEWRSTSSQAKFLGTAISITGAFVVTFYKGPIILSTQSVVVLPHQLLFSPQLNWVLGGLLLAAEAFIISSGYIIQVVYRTPLTNYPNYKMLLELNTDFYLFVNSADIGSEKVPSSTHCHVLFLLL